MQVNNFMQSPSSYYEKQALDYPYIEAKDYGNMQSICESFPHLKGVNKKIGALQSTANVNGMIIRSANDDNVHKGIKYGIWTTTLKNRDKIDQLWKKNNQNPKRQTYLFFSVVKSGMFEGVARLVSGMHEETFPFWWENHTMKFKGYFKIEWVFLKDINYKHFEGLSNVDGEEVTKSKDCDLITSETTKEMLEIFSTRANKRNIFIDFKYMDDREKKYIRPLYEQTIQNYRNMQNPYYQQSQLNYMQMSMNPTMLQMQMNGMVPPPMSTLPMQSPVQYLPLAKNQKPTGLGFQKNPVSKNRRK